MIMWGENVRKALTTSNYASGIRVSGLLMSMIIQSTVFHGPFFQDGGIALSEGDCNDVDPVSPERVGIGYGVGFGM